MEIDSQTEMGLIIENTLSTCFTELIQNGSTRLQRPPTYNEFRYNEHTASTSKIIPSAEIIDLH